MPFSLPATEREVNSQLDRLASILADMPATALSRYALAEIVLIRAASVFEDALAKLAYKLSCGAEFPDGTTDKIIVQSRSLIGARMAMRSEGGTRTVLKDYLKWTKSSHIAGSVNGVLDPQGHYVKTCQQFGSPIAEIFEVRNHAAHKNAGSRKNYLKWVKAQYGQERNIQLGYFLLTQNFSPMPNISRYISSIRIMVGNIVSGP